MNHRRARLRTPLPVRTSSPNRSGWGLPALLVGGAMLLTACTIAGDEPGDEAAADGGDQQSQTDGAGDGDGNGGQQEAAVDGGNNDEAGEGAADTLSFGDPADAGFEEVDDEVSEPTETPTADQEILSTPDEILPEITEQLQAEPVAGGEEILDAVPVIDTEADVPADRDGRNRNSTGELAVLDDAANLACAHIEIALSHLDDGNPSIAIERIFSAAEQAAKSQLSTIRSWEQPLAAVIADGAADDVAPLVGFITVCAEGGYEL